MALSCGKKLSALLREIASNHNGDFYCLNYLHSFWTKIKLISHEKVYENNDFCGVGKSFEENILLKFTQQPKSIKTSSLLFMYILNV